MSKQWLPGLSRERMTGRMPTQNEDWFYNGAQVGLRACSTSQYGL